MNIELEFSPDIVFFFKFEERNLLSGITEEYFLIKYWGDKDLCKNTCEFFRNKCIGDSCFIFVEASTLKFKVIEGKIKA